LTSTSRLRDDRSGMGEAATTTYEAVAHELLAELPPEQAFVAGAA
jgi:hypothetical protein